MADLQCEGCLEWFDEADLRVHGPLAFCGDCQQVPRHKQYGVRP